MRLELISFKLCPFVQRSVITLKKKKVPFELTFIDLRNPPQWFEEISPLGQVPVLKVGEGKAARVLFESAVINEYVDEITPPSLHPKDPLEKAFERAWIEFGSQLLGVQYRLFSSSDETEIEEARTELFQDLSRLEAVVSASGPYFRGPEFGLVDAAMAPLFMRLFLSKRLMSDPSWNALPRVRAWGERLGKEPAVRESVVPSFAEDFTAYCRAEESPLFG